MEKYKGICKCRLCGDEFNVETSITDEEFAKFLWPNFCKTPLVRHICKDGSWGAGDFKGFKKINEE